MRIELKDISKTYHLSTVRSFTFWQALFSTTSAELPDRRHYVQALKEIDLSIGDGEVVGVIGENGSGKSTLLKVIAEVIPPTEGTLSVSGKLDAILSLETQFQPEMTGRENVFHFLSVQGRTREDIASAAEKIFSFSGLDSHLDNPFKVFSDGMKARLAFSCITYFKPDILLIDETLAVGDAEFAQKSFQRIREIIEDGSTVVLVSHDLTAVEKICERTVWLHHGRIRDDGPSAHVVTAYKDFIRHRDDRKMRRERFLSLKKQPHEIDAIRFLDLALHGDDGSARTAFRTQNFVSLSARFRANRNMEKPKFLLTLERVDGLLLLSEVSDIDSSGSLKSGENYKISVDLGQLGLNSGNYLMRIRGIGSRNEMLDEIGTQFTFERSFYDTDQPIWYESA